MTLHFLESGRGTTLVLLHAFPMDSLLWAPQRRALAAAGYRVVTPDLPGFGGSPLAEGEPSLDLVADEVARLMDHLMLDRAIIGGLSFGGYVTMAMLRRYRERVAGIVLADTKAAADAPAARAGRLAMADSVLAAGSAAGLADGMLGNLLGATTRAQRPDVVSAVRRWIGAQHPAAVAWAQRAMAGRPDSHADITAFGGPCLVLYGEEDTLSPAADALALQSAALAGGGPAELVCIPGVGHLSAVEDPAAVGAALKAWLDRR